MRITCTCLAHNIVNQTLKLNFEKLRPAIFNLSLQNDQYRLAFVYLKVCANHLKGVQVMATINLQCNSSSQIHSSVYFRLIIRSMTGRAYVYGRNAETNLAEIQAEMSELLDKQVNVQTESLNKTSGVHASSCKPMKKCVMKRKERKKEEKTTAM